MKAILRGFMAFLMILMTGSSAFAQYPALSSHPDTSQFPYWIQMMKDPDANFYAARSAFNQYWQNRPVTRSSGWKIFKRWEYINRSRVQPGGKLPAPDNILRQYFSYIQNHQPLLPTANWTQVGPVSFPYNATGQPTGMGRINVIAFHPSDVNTMYIGSPSGGLWKTTNGGSSWTTLTDANPTLGVSAIIIHPSSPNTIWIGTGDRDAGDAPGMGVYKSTDGGTTWSASNSGMGNHTVCMMLLHPANTNILLAATRAGIYKSTDGGSSWTLKSIVANFEDLKFKPGDPTIAYATENGNFYRSTDTGDTWTQIISGIIAGNRIVIGVSPAQPGYVYLVQTNGPFAGALLSTNSGLTFTTQSTTPNITGYECDGSDNGSQAWYDLCIAVDPSNANILYAGGVNIWKSLNGGVSWSIVSHWIGSSWGVPCAASVHADQHCLIGSPLNGNLYSGNDGGIYYTANGGTTWTDLSPGLAITQVYKIGQSATSEPIVINGYQDNGTATCTGSAFSTVIGGDGMECIVDYIDTNYRYGELYFGQICRSSGSGYDQIGGNGFYGINEDGDWVTPYILHRTNPNTMFAGYDNVWKCANVKAPSGIAWNPISTGETSTCTVLEQSPANLNILYAVRYGQMKRTNHAGAATPAWNLCTLPYGFTPTGLAADPNDSNTVYATAAYYVYKSNDQGATWTNISGTLPAVPVNCIVFDKNSNGGIYVGTQTGVFYKDATLADWLPFSTGLPVTDVRELEIYYGADYASCRIKAATYGRGLWKSNLIGNGIWNPLTFAAAPVSTSEIDLTWTLNPNHNNVVLAYNTSPVFGNPVDGITYSQGSGIPGGGTVLYNGGATSYNNISLTTNSTYYYKIWSYNGSTQYSLGSTANATTFCTLISAFPWIEGFENGGSIPACWNQEYVSGANNWTFQTGGYFANPPAAHTGTYNAFFFISNFTVPETRLESPPVNLSGIPNPVLRFWHTQAYWYPTQDELRVYYRSSPLGAWTLLASYTSDIPVWTQESLQLPNASATYWVAFEGKADYAYGVCVDDVAVTGNSLSWNGTGNWADNTKWTPPYVPSAFDDVIINSGTCTVNNDELCHNILVKTGATLSVAPSKKVTAIGNITINP